MSDPSSGNPEGGASEDEKFQPFDSPSRPKLDMRIVGRGWRWWWSVLRFRHGTYVTPIAEERNG